MPARRDLLECKGWPRARHGPGHITESCKVPRRSNLPVVLSLVLADSDAAYTFAPVNDLTDNGVEAGAGWRTRVSQRIKRSAPDIRWFAISFGIGLASAAVGLAWKSGRQAGIPAFLFLLGAAIALTRIFVRHVEAAREQLREELKATRDTLTARISTLIESVDDTAAALASDTDLSPLALKLWDETRSQLEDTRARLDNSAQALRRGEVHFWGEDSALSYLNLVANEARHTIHAVDHIGPPQWFEHRDWHSYLTRQLARVARGEISLERIRAVSDHRLPDDNYRGSLIRFVRCHEEAGATILLCLESQLRRLKTYFHPSTGMLLIDREGRLACVTGSVGQSGYVDHGIVYLKRAGPLDIPLRDYAEVKQRLAAEAWDEELRKRLHLPPSPFR